MGTFEKEICVDILVGGADRSCGCTEEDRWPSKLGSCPREIA